MTNGCIAGESGTGRFLWADTRSFRGFVQAAGETSPTNEVIGVDVVMIRMGRTTPRTGMGRDDTVDGEHGRAWRGGRAGRGAPFAIITAANDFAHRAHRLIHCGRTHRSLRRSPRSTRLPYHEKIVASIATLKPRSRLPQSPEHRFGRRKAN